MTGLPFAAIAGAPVIVAGGPDDDTGLPMTRHAARVRVEQTLQGMRKQEGIVVQPQVKVVIALECLAPGQAHAAIPEQAAIPLQQVYARVQMQKGFRRAVAAVVVGDEEVEHRMR